MTSSNCIKASNGDKQLRGQKASNTFKTLTRWDLLLSCRRSERCNLWGSSPHRANFSGCSTHCHIWPSEIVKRLGTLQRNYKSRIVNEHIMGALAWDSKLWHVNIILVSPSPCTFKKEESISHNAERKKILTEGSIAIVCALDIKQVSTSFRGELVNWTI